MLMSPNTFEDPSKFIKYEEDSNIQFRQGIAIDDVDLFNIDSLIEGDVEEIVGNVSGSGYRWVWLWSSTSVEKAHSKATTKIKYSASRVGCNAIVGLTTNVTYFPGFLGFRGCSVFLTGTAVRISY